MLIAWILFFLFLSALFSGTEIAFISASKLMVELKKKKGTRRSRILADFFERPSEFLGTMLIGNNIALVVFSILMTSLLEPVWNDLFGELHGLVILLMTTVMITMVVLLFGEFLPKTIFRLYSDSILYFLAYPLRFLQWLLAVPTWLTTKVSNLLLRMFFRTKLETEDEAFTRLDLENFIKSSSTDADDDIDTELFEKALNLHEVKVKACMIPRTEIVSVDVNDGVDMVNQTFRDSKHSRILVVNEDIDRVMGYLHHQQLLFQPKSIKNIFFEIPIIPETMRVRDLMNLFIKNQQSIACVVDEFGGTSGLITFEDILEEIFGEIEDEHDVEDSVEMEIDAGEYLFSGRLELDYLNGKYPELDLPIDGEYHTLSGYLVMTTEEIPKSGQIIDLGLHRFEVDKISDTKIDSVKVFTNFHKVENE